MIEVQRMNKKIKIGLVALLGAFSLASCSSSEAKTKETTEQTIYFDNQVTYDESNPTAVYDHYFSNQLTLSDTGTSVSKNKNGELAGDFIKDGIARMALKSYTDGDTAVFYLDYFDSSATKDTYTVSGKTYPYVTIRFLGVDTPESIASFNSASVFNTVA